MLSPLQQAFYKHLLEAHPKFFSPHRTDYNAYPALAHLRTPAERYRYICEKDSKYSPQLEAS